MDSKTSTVDSMEFLEMKKSLGKSFRFLLFALIITTTFLMVENQTTSIEANTKVDEIDQESSQLDFGNLAYFNISDFTNTSHQINVSRVINANQYGYTSSRTEISVYNNGSKDINAFNLTLPKNEYEDSKYFKIYSINDTEDESTIWEVFDKNETILVTTQFPVVGKNEKVSLIIEMDHQNAISFEDDAKLIESTYPYQFNLSFMPLISFPITSYDLKWFIGTDIEVLLDNDTLQPNKGNFTGELIQDPTELRFEGIKEIYQIDREVLNKTEFGSYNLSALTDLMFIPLYNQNTAENLTIYFVFDYYQQAGTFITFSSLKTTIEVSEWGTIYTKQEILIKNIGIQSGPVLSTDLGARGGPFPTLSFQIPETASYVGLKDYYGNLTPTVITNPESQKRIVEIAPRVQIEKDAEYHLILSYRESSSDIINDLGGGKVRLINALTMNFNWTIQHFELDLLFPSGSNINLEKIKNETYKSSLRVPSSISAIHKKEFLGLFNKKGYRFIFENFTPLSNKEMKIEFGLSPFYQLHPPLSFGLFFLVVGIIYAVARNLTFGYKPKKFDLEELQLDLIKKFVKVYEEKTAVREQLIRLDRKRKTKKLSAREYEQTRMILKNQQQQNDRLIVTVSRQLADANPRYRISMRSIEVAEASREDYLKNIESLDKKKAQGRIGKEAYTKLKIDYDKKLRKTNNDIDKVLIELRNLLIR